MGWGLACQWFGKLHSPHTTSPPKGRGEWEGCLARSPVQPGLGTLPEAPETMLGMKAARPGAGPGRGVSSAHPFTVPAPAQAYSTLPFTFGLLALFQASGHQPLGTLSRAALPESLSPTRPRPKP